MKVIVVSDSHGNFGILKKIVEQEEPFDLLIHLGDGLEEGLRLRRIKEFNFDAVSGNNDPSDLFPVNLLLKLGREACFFTHGDLYHVNQDINQLFQVAKKERAEFVFFGHTHLAVDIVFKGIRFLNPGSVCNYLSSNPGYLRLEMMDKSLQINKIAL